MKRLISNRGTAFTSSKFREYCIRLSIIHHITAVHHPRANGQVERVNDTLVVSLMTSCLTKRTWDCQLPHIELVMNTVANRITGYSPFQLLHGFTPVLTNRWLACLTELGQKRPPMDE